MTTDDKLAVLQQALVELEQQEYVTYLRWQLVNRQVAAVLKLISDLEGS